LLCYLIVSIAARKTFLFLDLSSFSRSIVCVEHICATKELSKISSFGSKKGERCVIACCVVCPFEIDCRDIVCDSDEGFSI
jgi:hypothetical protein